MWPACEWRQDMDNLIRLSEFMEDNTPTGEVEWCGAVESEAADIYLDSDQFWDAVVAPGYRMLTSLPLSSFIKIELFVERPVGPGD